MNCLFAVGCGEACLTTNKRTTRGLVKEEEERKNTFAAIYIYLWSTSLA